MATGFFLKDVRAARTNIYIIVRIAGQRYKKSTGIMIDPKYWNSTTQTIRDTKELPSAKVFINRLKEWRQAADTVCDGIMAGAAIPLPDEFWARVVEIMGGSPEAPASQLFGDYFKTYIERRRADHGCRNTLKKYITAYNRFCEFERDTHRHYRFADINMRFYEKYRAYILSRGYVSNYFGMLVSCIKVVYREAREVDHLHNLHETELRGFSTPFTTSKSIYLSTDELRTMADVEITPEALVAMDPALAKLSAPKMRLKVEALKLVRNKFLLGAYTALRVSDFNRLSKINIDGDFFRITTRKTGAAVVIPIHPVIRRMMDEGFDIATPITDQKINRHIKEVARLAGITAPVEGTKLVNHRAVVGWWPKCDIITTHTAGCPTARATAVRYVWSRWSTTPTAPSARYTTRQRVFSGSSTPLSETCMVHKMTTESAARRHNEFRRLMSQVRPCPHSINICCLVSPPDAGRP